MSYEGDNADDAPLGVELGWRYGLWSPLLGLVFTVACGHSVVLVINWLGGAVSPQDFSLPDFALVWVTAAVGASLLEYWNQWFRRREQGSPSKRCRSGASRRPVGSIFRAFWFATFLSGYMAAANGELRLIEADALMAFAFVLSVIARLLITRRRRATGSAS